MLERSRAEALNPDVINEYFGLLGETLGKLGLKNKPRQIFNCDETFLPLDCNKEKAIARKEQRIHIVSLTAQVCISLYFVACLQLAYRMHP